MAQPVVKLDEKSQLVVDRGRQAWKSIKSDETWEKWVAIGNAVAIGRAETMRLLHTNQPKGGQWGRVFGAWLEEQGFAEIDKGVRSRLQNCLDNLPAIEAMRQNMGLTQRLQLNHPNAVWRRFQGAAQVAAEKTKGTGNSGRPGLREEIMRLQAELDAAHRRLEAAEGNDWDWQDTPEEIAQAMLASHPAKAKRVGAAILAQSKSTAKKPR